MRRFTFDVLTSTVGLLLAAILLLAGALGLWGYTFVNNQVTTQLTKQKIYFPTTSNPEFKALPASDMAAMRPYAGQQMTSGAQAETYANHFIAYHLSLVAGGKTYSQVSAQALAHPANPVLAKQSQILFQGTTLRGLLLNAYAFWQIGQILLIASICAIVVGFVVLILSIIGFLHSRRVPAETEVLRPRPSPVR